MKKQQKVQQLQQLQQQLNSKNQYSQSFPQEINSLEIDQANDDIPYKKIQTAKIFNITQENINNEVKYIIQIDSKIEQKPKSTQHSFLIRNAYDFQWLFNKLELHHSQRFLIVPLISFDSDWKSILPKFLVNITKTELSSKQEVYRKQYHQKMLFRFLNILFSISIKYLYWKPKQFSTPIFIFISSNDNFDFYKQLDNVKQKEKNTSTIYSNSFWSGLENIGKTILNNIPLRSKNNNELETGGLSDVKKDAEVIHNRGQVLMQKFLAYKDQMQVLYQNFVRLRQDIKNRISMLMILIFRLSNQIKLSKLILDQIQSVTKKYQKFLAQFSYNSKQGQKNSILDQQLMFYKDFVSIQLKQINKSIKKIGNQFLQYNVTKGNANLLLIEVGSLYQNYKVQKQEDCESQNLQQQKSQHQAKIKINSKNKQ